MSTPLTSEDPATVGPYELVGRLGEGGMGVVYLATGPNGRQVALKVIRRHLASHDAFLERFRQEVALARKVARFCTAPILDSDTDATPPYIVTEYVHGPTLTSAVADHGPLDGSELHSLAVGVASALSAIHRAGVIHRDLKPSNVLLSRYGPRVIDFGIAKAADAMSSITQTGEMVGSPSYMSPERFRGEPIGPASDVFAWGSVLAFAGTGRPPFGTNNESVYFRILHGEPDLDGLDAELCELAEWAMRKDPAERPTAQQLLDALLAESGGTAAARVAARATLPAPAADPDTATDTPEPVTAVAAAPRRRRATAAVAAATVLVLAAAAVAGTWALNGKGTGGSITVQGAVRSGAPVPRTAAPPPRFPAVVFDNAAKGPAAAIPGARRGGTITGLNDEQWTTALDPQRNYSADAMSMTSALLFRTLTGYVQDGSSLKLVGDLATNTGVTTDGGETWEYTLRDGIAFEDGSPIQPTDVAWGIARSFTAQVDGGPNHIQNWLAGTRGLGFQQAWQPTAVPGSLPRGIELVPGTRKIRFHLDEQRPEFPMVAALGTTAPVQRPANAHIDAGAQPLATGPYRIAARSATRLELARNEAWKPETDPIRHNYPDRWVFEMGKDVTEETASTRLITPSTADQASFMWNNITANLLPVAERKAPKRILTAPSPRMKYLAINTRRVRDVEVRKAINAAIDRRAALDSFGGRSYGTESLTLRSSAMPEFSAHTGLGIGIQGDPAKAKKLLGRRTVRLRYLYRSASGRETKLAEYVRRALGDVGLKVDLVPFPGRELDFLEKIGEKDNPYELYSFAWIPDIPDGAGMFDLWNGETIEDTGNKNVSYFGEIRVKSRIQGLEGESDRAKAAIGYAELDRWILADFAPVVPLFERTRHTLYGPSLRGLYINRVFGAVGLVNAYVVPVNPAGRPRG